MVATVTIRRHHGATPTKTDITTLNTRAQTTDANATPTGQPTTYPIPIVSGQTKRSYWIVTRLSADTTPAGTINNIKWYSDGTNSLGTGVTCNGNDATAYTQATGTEGDTGTELTTGNYPTLSAAASNVFSWTSAAPKSITGSITNPNTGDFGNYFVYQISVVDTASPGATASETFTWQYDET